MLPAQPASPVPEPPVSTPAAGPAAGKIDFTALKNMPKDSAGGLALAIIGVFLIWPFLVGIPMVIGGLYLWSKRENQKKQAFASFLLTNGWQYDPLGEGDYVATSLLGVGHDQSIVTGFGGTYRGRSMHAVHYRYVTGNGRSQEEHDFLDVCIDIEQTLPLIVLDSKRNKIMGIFRDLPERIQGGKKLELEGDFNDKFDVTVMPGSEQEVLEFLTPDFMQTLMSGPQQTDIEMEANKTFAIMHVSTFNYVSLTQLFAAADIVLDQLDKIAGTWQASTSSEGLESMAAEALAPRSKLILKPKHVGITSALVLIAWLIYFFATMRH